MAYTQRGVIFLDVTSFLHCPVLFQTGRAELVSELYRLLVPAGTALVMAPERAGTLSAFRDLAEQWFKVDIGFCIWSFVWNYVHLVFSITFFYFV